MGMVQLSVMAGGDSERREVGVTVGRVLAVNGFWRYILIYCV